jgi:peptidoglycan/LPS O-acetylase OafA/YrhL
MKYLELGRQWAADVVQKLWVRVTLLVAMIWAALLISDKDVRFYSERVFWVAAGFLMFPVGAAAIVGWLTLDKKKAAWAAVVGGCLVGAVIGKDLGTDLSKDLGPGLIWVLVCGGAACLALSLAFPSAFRMWRRKP